MESQPQNPEFRINPENFHPCSVCTKILTMKKNIINNKILQQILMRIMVYITY